MAKVKYDGVVEAVHFKPDGQLDWLRVYLRQDAAFSDRILLSRQAFIAQLKSGKHFMLGERIQNLGGMFTVTKPVHLLDRDHSPVIVVGDSQAAQDDLTGVPII